jgi:hypothetical protein
MIFPLRRGTEGVALFGIASREVAWPYYSEVFVSRIKPTVFRMFF